jgi:hypothetical protein
MPVLKDAGLRQAQARARKILDSPEYEELLLERCELGTLPAVIEQLLWHYAYGKPTEHSEVVLKDERDLTQLSDAELERETLLALRALEASKRAERERTNDERMNDNGDDTNTAVH